MQIPKKLHLIWIGSENKRPESCIASWRAHHPDWDVKLWNNHDLFHHNWVNQKHIETLWDAGKWSGVADLMRYEILYRHGGVYVDADSVCLRPLDDWLLASEMFACWTNEFTGRPLVHNGFLGTKPDNLFLRFVIEQAEAKRNILTRFSWRRMRRTKMGAWRSVGPHHLTECIRLARYDRITIWPSHLFQPHHYRGSCYTGGGIVYADHFWGSTTKRYEPLDVPEPHMTFRYQDAGGPAPVKIGVHAR